jgi:hypothetical protein
MDISGALQYQFARSAFLNCVSALKKPDYDHDNRDYKKEMDQPTYMNHEKP